MTQLSAVMSVPALRRPATALRVLVADDQREVIEAVRLLLEAEGMTTVGARSPAEALSAAQSQPVHAALVDLNYDAGRTNGEQGLDLVARLRQHDPNLPITVMTGWSTSGLALEAMRRGAREFIEKPWDATRLVATLRSHAELGAAMRLVTELEAEVARLKGGGEGAPAPPSSTRLLEVEGQMVRRSMERHRGNVSRAARELGLSRSALYRRLERHKLSTTGVALG